MKVLVIYYSRSGNTRNVAGRIAGSLETRGAEVVVEELVDRKSRKRVAGLISACVDSALGLKTDICAPEASVPEFDVVVVGTPIWAWAGTPAAQAFCRTWGRKAKRTALFCTMMSPTPGGTFKALSSALQDEPLATLAVSHSDLKENSRLEVKISHFAEKIVG